MWRKLLRWWFVDPQRLLEIAQQQRSIANMLLRMEDELDDLTARVDDALGRAASHEDADHGGIDA